MDNIQTLNIKISDFKNLLYNIRDNYKIDFSDYSLSSLKRRVELFSLKYHINTNDELIYRLNKDNKFFQLFLKSILVDETEMFRDSEFWNELKENIIDKSKNNEELKIWLPHCNSGEELYSLLILLDKLNLIDHSSICVSSLSSVNIDRISEASIELKNMEANNANYERSKIGVNLMNYFKKKPYYVEFKDLFQNTSIIKHDIILDEVPDKFDIILFRNKMLYFNKQLSNKVLVKLKNALKSKGLIAVGIKENINYPGYEKELSVICANEKIYKKN